MSVEKQRLRGAPVDVAERPDREEQDGIAGRPPIGPEVADVEELTGPDGAHGIAQVPLADVRVALALEEDTVAPRLRLAAKKRNERAACHGVGWTEAGGFEQRRGDVREADERVDGGIGAGDAGPADGQGHVRAAVVDGGLRPGERQTVIRRDDDDGACELAGLFEQVEQAADVAVEALDLEVVIEQVVADVSRVGQVSRHAHRVSLHAALPAASRLVRAVGVGASEPEAEWAAGRARPQELLEALERRAGRVPRAAAGFEAPGPPPFAREPDDVAGLLQQVGIHHVPLREVAVQASALLEAVDGLAGQERGA